MRFKKAAACILSSVMALSSVSVAAVYAENSTEETKESTLIGKETLGRGLVAVKTDSGIFLSWRLQDYEDTVFGSSESNVSFNIYRDDTLIGNESTTTNYIDASGTTDSKYSVAPVINNVEGEKCDAVTAFGSGSNYFEIPLTKPADETITDSSGNSNVYSFSPADCSCGDLDGDGEYEIIVKWTSNELDVGNAGYSGTVRFAAYKQDGTKMWDNDINLGQNVFSSAHTAQFLVYDFDGDGKAEMTVQTAPGSKDAAGEYVSEASSDTSIKPYIIQDIDKNKLTVSMKDTTPVIYAAKYNEDGTIQDIQKFTDYKAGDNVLEADFEIDKAFIWDDMKPVNIADPETESIDYREKNNGRITSGPEYLTVFNGETGEAIDTINYPVARVSVSCWGKNDGGNRGLRFLADIAYLDGEKPYAVYWRGYYDRGSGRTGVAGISFDGERLSVDYMFDTLKNQPGYVEGAAALYTGQGNHSMIAADIDDDGNDEVISGALCLEATDDFISGSDKTKQLNVKWCTFREHGDAHHIGDYDPTNPGLEYFTVQEHGDSDITTDTGETKTLDFGMTVVSATDGKELFHNGASKDTGRGMMANVGAGGYYQIASSAGNYISNGGTDFEQSNVSIGTNFRIYWDGDLYDELLDGTSITNYDGSKMSEIFNASGCTKINGTKSTPCLSADLFGDWREEVVYPTTDGSALRIFTTNIKTDYKMKSLVYDRLYRNGVAAEQTAYNQPPHIGYYLSDEVFYGTLTGIDVENTKSTYYVGEEFDKNNLTVTANYSDAESRSVTNYSVSGYDPMQIGEQTVTIKYLSEEKTVTVNVVAESSISVSNTKIEYKVGEELDKTSFTVKLVYADGYEKDVTGFKVTGYDSMKTGSQELTVSYTGAQNTYTQTVDISVISDLIFDETGVVTGYSGSDTEITIPLYTGDNGETKVTAIANNALESSSLTKIYIYSEDITLSGDNIFPSGVTIVCYEDSTAQAYALNHAINVEIMTKGDAVTFEEDFYTAYTDKNMLMQTTSADQTLKDEFVTYCAKAASNNTPWYQADTYGFSIKSESDNSYLTVNAGIYDSMNQFNQIYMTLNETKDISETQTIAFDIMFPSGSSAPYVELQNEAGTIIDTISVSASGLSNDKWYRYELTFDGTNYSSNITDTDGNSVKDSETLSVTNGSKILSAIAFKQDFNGGAGSGTVYVDNILIN